MIEEHHRAKENALDLYLEKAYGDPKVVYEKQLKARIKEVYEMYKTRNTAEADRVGRDIVNELYREQISNTILL